MSRQISDLLVFASASQTYTEITKLYLVHYKNVPVNLALAYKEKTTCMMNISIRGIAVKYTLASTLLKYSPIISQHFPVNLATV